MPKNLDRRYVVRHLQPEMIHARSKTDQGVVHHG
jgi:hypothetical protein